MDDPGVFEVVLREYETDRLSDILSLLASDSRREVLVHIASDDRRTARPHHLGELTDAVADAEGVAPTDDEARDRIRATLHHNHIPKIEAFGVLDYDARNHTARYYEHPLVEHLSQILDR